MPKSLSSGTIPRPGPCGARKCPFLVTRSLDPTGKGRTRWAMRWKPALNAFAITFADRILPSNANEPSTPVTPVIGHARRLVQR